MEALDLLKKDWQRKENLFEQVSEANIYGMLHKKSSSIVKWILIISLIELGLGVVLSLLSFDTDILNKIDTSGYGMSMKLLTVFNYAIVLYFVYLFYKNYIKISTTKSTKALMDDIILVRKTVKYYIWYNLFMIGLSSIFGILFALKSNPKLDDFVADWKNLVAFGTIAVLVILFLITVFWLIYRLIYGRLLRKLFANYNELKKIDL